MEATSDCLKCISDSNVLPSKTCKTYLLVHSSYIFKEEEYLIEEFYIVVFLILSYVNNPLAPCSSINLGFLLSHTAHFDESIGFP